MKVTGDMIHPDIRMRGVMIRRLFRFRTERQFRSSTRVLEITMKGRYPRDMHVVEREIDRPDGTRLRILVCTPANQQPDAVGVLWIHGGGYALGIPEIDLGYARKIMENCNAVVVMPDYTLSVDKPYPAALEDCYTALRWLQQNTAALHVNPSQLFVGGDSAGGGLTAALSLYARDRHEVSIAWQMPLYPMIDCRMETPSMQDNDAPVWDEEANRLGWQLYLGPLYGSDHIPAYASPSLATDYTGLPPTYTFVGSIEPFCDETKAYIENLRRAGVPADMDVYEGGYHALDLFGTNTPLGKTATSRWIAALVYAAGHYYAPQPKERR